MTILPFRPGQDHPRIVRRFRALLGLDALHEANVAANPVAYLERASERIHRLQKTIFEAAQALAPSGEAEGTEAPVLVDGAEYRRLLACKAIIERARPDLHDPDDF